MPDEFPRSARFAVRQDARGEVSIKLDDLELSRLILSGSLRIEYVPLLPGGPDAPQVTMTLAPGALDFDLDVESLQALLAIAKGYA
jgi:hypothetical protein